MRCVRNPRKRDPTRIGQPGAHFSAAKLVGLLAAGKRPTNEPTDSADSAVLPRGAAAGPQIVRFLVEGSRFSLGQNSSQEK